MKKIIVNIIASILILYGLFGSGLLDLFDKPIKPQPEPVPSAILNIDKPSEEVINEVAPVAAMINDPTDRAKLAIFNHQFATNVISYETNLQQVNDVYVLAGKTFFQGSIAGKYKDLPSSLVKLIESVTGSDNHILSQEEKLKISEKFMGFAWALIQRGK